MLRAYAVDWVRTRLRGFLVIVSTGLILLVSFALTSTVTVFGRLLEGTGRFESFWLPVTDTLLSIIVVGLLFAAIFRTMPRRNIGWSAVWVGSYLTAALFVAGKQLIAHVIASASWTTYYGPGASVVAFLFWVFLSAQIFYLGAEFTKVWARRRALPAHP